MSHERFVTIKELAGALASFGVEAIGYKRARLLVHAMRQRGCTVISRNMVRPSDAYAFLLANPDWAPYKQHAEKA